MRLRKYTGYATGIADPDSTLGAWSTTATASLPGPPSALASAALTLGDTQITASWKAPAANHSAITGYNIRYRPTGGTWSDHDHSGLATGATITGLTNDIQYEVQLNAVNSIGTGEWSPSAKATPQAAVPDCAPWQPPASTVRPAGLHWTVLYQLPTYGCAVRLSGMELRYKAADVSTWTITPLSVVRLPGKKEVSTGLSWDVHYEMRVRASSSYGSGAWSHISKGTPTEDYSLAETGVGDRDQTWTVYLRRRMAQARGPRHVPRSTPRSSIRNSRPSFRRSPEANTTPRSWLPPARCRPANTPRGSRSTRTARRNQANTSSSPITRISDTAGRQSSAGPAGGGMPLVNSPSINPYDHWDNAWVTAGHEIGHTLGWHHYRNSLDPWEFMNIFYHAPYDEGAKSGWCGSGQSTNADGEPPIPDTFPPTDP